MVLELSAVELLLESRDGTALAFPFAAVAAAVLPKLLGGILAKGDAKRANKQSASNVASDRAYGERRFAIERRLQLHDLKRSQAYARKTTAADRKYAESRLSDERRYAGKQAFGQRKYAAALTAGDRKYAEDVYAKERKTYKQDSAMERRLYKADRAEMQRLSDRQAERQTASRGIDFQAVRDDAIAAGFNPLTALAFANNYSTEVGYHNSGQAYAGGVGVGGGSAGGPPIVGSHSAPGVSAAPGAIVTSAPPTPMSYSSPGVGYASTPAPAFASNEFLADALGAGVSTYFNEQAIADEATYRSIERQVASSQLGRMLQSQNPYQDFGYTRQAPYSSAVSVSGGSGLDPLHQRPVERVDVQDVPFTAMVDVGGGHSVRAVNPDLDLEGPIGWGNSAWIAANSAVANMPGRFGDWMRSGGKFDTSFKVVPRAGTASSMWTGTTPRAPVFGGWAPSFGGD